MSYDRVEVGVLNWNMCFSEGKCYDQSLCWIAVVMPIQQVGFWRPVFSRLPGDNVQAGVVIPEGGLN